MDVRDKVVAITGAARGLGQEFARSLAAAGARVIAADINDCTATLDLVRAEQTEGVAARLDVTDPGSAREMVDTAVQAFGRLDALINNAALYGALHGGRFDAIEEAEWDAAMAVNVKGIWNCCKAAVPAMRQAGGGSIVNIASLAATYGMPFGRVNALAPSAVITEGTREFFGARMERALETIKSGQTIQRNLVPEDLAGTMMWLISDASGFVTGQTIAVDGGTVML